MDNEERTPNENGAAGETAEKKKHPVWRAVLLGLLIAVILAVAALTTMEDGRHFATLRRWLIYGNGNSTQDVYTYAPATSNCYGLLGDALAVVSRNTIQIIGRDGVAVCEESVSLESPQLSVGKAQAAACSPGGDTIYVLDKAGIRRTMQADRGLCYYSARMNGSDYLAVTEQSPGYKAAVSVYNPAGELEFHFDSHDSYLSDAVVTEDGRYLAAVSLGSADGVFASRLLVYDLASAEQVSETAIRDGLVMDFSNRADRLLNLCDSRFTITTLTGETLLDKAYGNLYLHDYAITGGDFAALLLGRYQAGNICTLSTYDLDGMLLASLEVTDEVLDLSAAGDYLAVLYGDSLAIYDNTLSEIARLDTTDYAGQVRMDPKGTALLISASSAWRFLP